MPNPTGTMSNCSCCRCRPQVVTWILRDVYIDGEEFTMNSQRMRLEKVISPAEEATPPAPDSPPPSRTAIRRRAGHLTEGLEKRIRPGSPCGIEAPALLIGVPNSMTMGP